MTIYDIAILAAATGYVLVDGLQLYIRFDLRRKPFNCGFCLSGWAALVLSVINGYFWPAAFIMCLAMCVYVLFKSTLNRFNSGK